MESSGPRIPQSGETLILGDGRRFVISTTEGGVRGWWFRATAHDGGCTLQGNLKLEWDPGARTWRPHGTRALMAPPPSMHRAPVTRQRQAD